MAKQKKRNLHLHHQQIQIKFMKTLILLYLAPLFCFSQLLEIRLEKKIFNVNDSIVLNVKSNDTVNRFLNIQLEKYDSKINTWKLYSKDVFTKPFTPPLELTLVIKSNDFLGLKFKINQPELFDSPKYSKKKNEFIRENAKKGTFRIKVLNGFNEWGKNELVYSDSFIIK